MKKFFTNVSIVLLITFILFITINIFISYSWQFYNFKKYEKNDPFSVDVQNTFDLSREEIRILHRDTHKLKFYFKAFTGPKPKNYESKFVNYNISNGRKTTNPINCEKNYFLFGGSTTFGWLSIDDETIASHLSKIINKKYKNTCVYNYGVPFFYSKQENNFLLNLLEEEKIPDYAIFLDGINERCDGYAYEKNIKRQFSEINRHRALIFYAKLPALINSLPFVQLYERLVKKDTNVFEFKDVLICSEKKLKANFENRLKLRNEICKLFSIKCKSFLQPFGGINSKNYPGSETLGFQLIKYNLFKKIDERLIIDISGILDDDPNKLSYVDRVHYTHNSNYLIAMKISEHLFRGEQ